MFLLGHLDIHTGEAKQVIVWGSSWILGDSTPLANRVTQTSMYRHSLTVWFACIIHSKGEDMQCSTFKVFHVHFKQTNNYD